MMRKTVAMLSLALFAMFASTAAYGQAVYGNIVGSVTDSSGAAVANAKVTITDLSRGVSVNAQTNESGNFTQRFLIVGRYQVRVEAPGFKSALQEVGVSVDQEVSLDIKLQPGAVSEEVTITSEAPLLKTERADVAITFSEKTLTNLPLLNRRFTSVEIFTPGVTAWPAQTAASEDPQGSFRKVVNGQSFAGTSHLLDGTDNHDALLGLIVINPTMESITEAKVTTSAYDAEFGANAGVVSSQTKSGTNDLHFSAFEFLRNDHFNARNPFTQFNPIRGTNNRYIPVTQINQFGGSASGKIIPNKLFWFGDYQGTRRNIGGSVITRVPTAAERAGDFTAAGLPNIFDPAGSTAPAGRTQFQFNGRNNVIPTNRISPIAVALLNKYIPLPNFTPASADQPNYVGAGTAKFNEDLTNTRWDYYVNEKIHTFGRYSFSNYSLTSPGVYGSLAGGVGFQPGSTFAGESKTRNQSVAAGFDYTVSDKWLTDFRFGFFRYRVNVDPGQSQTTPAKDNNIPGLNNDSFTGGMPFFNINGVGALAFGYALGVNACNCPLRQNERQFQFVNNWTNLNGNHTFKFGADIRRAANLRIPSDRHRSGELQFDAARTQGPSGGGTGLASFLLGEVSRFERYVSTITDAEERQNRWFFYGQDTWKVNKKLTLNYGVRWEIYRPQTVTGAGKGGFVDVNTGEVLIAGSQGVGLDLNQNGTLKNISPRFGLAYRLTDKTVVRLGYGRGFDIGVFGSVFGHNVTQNLPVLGIQSLQPAQNYLSVFSLTQGPTALDPATILNAQAKGPNGRPILPNGVTAFILPQTLRLPTSDQWNVTIQRQLPWDISVEASYVGTKGTHVFAGNGGDYDFNQATIQGFVDANGRRGLTTNQRKLFFNKFGWSQNFRYYGSDASSNYHGAQFKAERRFTKGVSVLSHYTWSRSFNYTNTYYNIDATQAYGPNDQTRTHVFLLAGVFELPFGKGKKFLSDAPKAVNAVLGGWQMNTVWQLQSGLPFTPTYRDCSAERDTGWCRPNLVGDWRVDNPTRNQWFRTAAAPLQNGPSSNPSDPTVIFRAAGPADGPWQRPATGTFGSIGRNRLEGPGLSNVDVSFFKSFQITERVKAQFRAESFNFANRINLANPGVGGNGACVDCPGIAGRITSMLQSATPRQWQFALRLEF
jgi:outer membrane receptor protein involved in Fe transport